MTQLSVVIISSRETIGTVLSTIGCTLAACQHYSYQLHLFCNGDELRAKALSEIIAKQFPNEAISVWYFALADKANCMNVYWHNIQPAAELHVFIDGYVRLESDCFLNLMHAHQAYHALAYTGTPANGRSSKQLKKQMSTEGGIHGNLIALPALSLEQLKHTQFRIPIGLYRTDSTLGAHLCFSFHPEMEQWKPSNIKVVTSATWFFDNLCWYKPRDIKTHLLRVRRQALGIIENKAVRQVFALDKCPASELPEMANELCLSYLSKHPLSLRDYLKNPLLLLAIRDLKKRKSHQSQIYQRQSEYWILK